MPPRRRPTAFEVSFPGEKEDEEAKRHKLPKDAYYKALKDPIKETMTLVITGEDPSDGDDDKPIRELHEFTIFDPSRRNELVTLEALEQDDGIDRAFEAAGYVKPHYLSEEDEGQEEEQEEPQYVHLGAIMRYTVDYSQESEALKRPNEDFKSFLDRLTKRVDMFGRTYVQEHIWDNLVDINEIIRESEHAKKIMAVPFVKTILQRAPQSIEPQRIPRNTRPLVRKQPKNLIGNPDISVLKSENQNTTCVTPRIAKLAKGLFREEMMVLGPPPPPVNKAEVEALKNKAAHNLRQLISRAKAGNKKITYRKDDRIKVGGDYYSSITIEGVEYKMGDVVLFPIKLAGDEVRLKAVQPDKSSRVDHFFWFAKIIYIMAESHQVHVQWFNHGSQTILNELAHPQELFLSDLCGHDTVNHIVAKVTVHYLPNEVDPKVKAGEYFCKFSHDIKTGVFADLDTKRIELCNSQRPPDNCPVCPLLEEIDMQKTVMPLKDNAGNINGLAFAGVSYHLEDFVLYRAEKGPANIGYITQIVFPSRMRDTAKVTMRKVGRISDLDDEVLPEGVLRDERHLFITDETVKVDVSEDSALLQVIYVPCSESFEDPSANLEDWLELSYDHFYVLYSFPRLAVKHWDERKKTRWQRHEVCSQCCKEILEKRKGIYKFLKQTKPLATLDLFGGVGALSRGLADGSGCLKVTHAVEIAPSAARTFAINSPETTVYNQCANEILRYAVKSQLKHDIEIPKQIYDNKTPISAPPKPGDIKVITAGFPCQSHSTLNIYKNADDPKSNLILTTLSYLDYYSPDFAYFENVPGFLRFSLRATHENEYGLSGDVDMGGVKLLLRSLIDMHYQFQFALLQAAHYGTPQRRVRFFLVAAKTGQVLPAIPQPTHDFPDSTSLSIKFADKLDVIAPIRMAHGTARNRCVTIKDAIGDLPRFDWLRNLKHPSPDTEDKKRKDARRRRAREVAAVDCNVKDTYSGFSGKIGYHIDPKTRYQKQARLKETIDIQHYTRCLLPRKVERVLCIPLKAGADYMSLPADRYEWQIADPTSSVGRRNYIRGLYGRLDQNKVFPTTVTNVDPTAKQCQVLNPWCHRMVTVRELARSQGFPDSFVFKTIGKLNVVTIHRQIGNAVPLPLAHALGRELRESLFNLWNRKREDAIVIEDDELARGVEHQHLANDSDDDMYV
ncbi:DNA (cytosine-5)-methyltransferase 1 [Psilocybe cubensis]|uniref:DNA (Cytosine-5)-methyltransferase 1 n=1 Tax=Psilocybe cubensis TaxID=181762 RepID=A0ACB8HFG9_PSICU|nr:DNA (cytosine-5)-methyltransferase 1 [Psilocybe cubensis]KAH9486450.1 DNA (cytosine-5)-methyltransferase 1 [Psilocybe cubensis]